MKVGDFAWSPFPGGAILKVELLKDEGEKWEISSNNLGHDYPRSVSLRNKQLCFETREEAEDFLIIFEVFLS